MNADQRRKRDRARRFGLYELTLFNRDGWVRHRLGWPQVLEWLGDLFGPDQPCRKAPGGYEVLAFKPETDRTPVVLARVRHP